MMWLMYRSRASRHSGVAVAALVFAEFNSASRWGARYTVVKRGMVTAVVCGTEYLAAGAGAGMSSRRAESRLIASPHSNCHTSHMCL
jgi:hypothetical protein